MTRLRLLTGAPGAGKTALLPHLTAYRGRIVAADFDEVLDARGTVLGTDITGPAAEPLWPAYNRLWARFARILLRSDAVPVLLCPLSPDEWRSAAVGLLDGVEVAWARLDCADGDRRTRLAARGWDARRIAAALDDAAELRRTVPRSFSSTGRSPADLAADVAAWAAAP
ncbi:hypothetical protein [Actinocatenispora rupis]|uniref:AAA domain-containing protein n=1 Tax=Actinocatenispora rupis TaxID=519421 RepID=A0A8J3NA64_9ACTN|nr:hypothetical protein [Actinocatenispora rupis]GID11781.1 hypothetical protein Aru02nite_26700 [Actinocatenispora rupis]